MEEEISLYFDIPSLLKLTKIDIRKAARANRELLTKEYFSYLSKFLEKAPAAKENLERIFHDNPEAGQFCVANLENMDYILEVIGAEKCAELAAEIVRLYKRGNKDYIIKQAHELVFLMDIAYEQVESCKREHKPELLTGILNAEELDFAEYEKNPLYITLRLKEHEEATRKPQILAVDDSPTMLKTISSVLGSTYKVYGMSNPLMIQNFLKQITPDLFLLDYQMPQASGFDLVPIIRGFEEHKKTPIIFLTSSGSPDHITTAINLGACDYVVKPFQGKQLHEKIAKHIRKKPAAPH